MSDKPALVIIEHTTITVQKIGSYQRPPNMAGLTGRWSKWGGGQQSAFKEKVQGVWSCQSCGQKQVAELSPYLYEYPAGEYVRVCARCLADDCRRMKERLQSQE